MCSRCASIASRRVARSVRVRGVPSRVAPRPDARRDAASARGSPRAVPYNAHKNAAKSIASGTAESRMTPIRQRPGD
ncbi:hypothetical protein C6Q12_02320 [Burkholderia multivorans]|nr:hypothetical protein C6Q12_02320 [Burkholderia multivorans]